MATQLDAQEHEALPSLHDLLGGQGWHSPTLPSSFGLSNVIAIAGGVKSDVWLFPTSQLAGGPRDAPIPCDLVVDVSGG